MTDGKTHDVRILDVLPIEAASFYILDRGYQASLAGRIVFSMDQTEPANQVVLRNLRERGSDADLGGDRDFSLGRHHQEKA